MVICICNSLKSDQLENASKCCKATSAEELYDSLGCKPQCGQCLCYVEEAYLSQNAQVAQQ